MAKHFRIGIARRCGANRLLLCAVTAGIAMALWFAAASADEPPSVSNSEPLPTPAKSVKVPVPDKTALDAARKLVGELHNSDMAAARSAASKSALSDRIDHEAVEEKTDMAGKFVSLETALDLAAGAGDLAKADRVIEQVDDCFVIAAADMRGRAAQAALKALPRGVDHSAFISEALLMAGRAEADDNYPLAKILCDSARSASIEPSSQRRQVETFAKRLAVLTAAFDKVRPSIETQKTNPADGAANLVVGRFRCFYKDEWESGLPMLAIGSDPRLKKIAAADLSQKSDPAALVTLADDWWQQGDSEGADAALLIHAHAAAEYKSALPGLTGLSRAKAARRIDEATASAVAVTHSTRAFRAAVTETACDKEHPSQTLLGGDEGFCLLGYLSGHFEGGGEIASVELNGDQKWATDCEGFTERMDPKFLAYKVKPNHTYDGRATFFHWSRGEPKIKMISKDEGVCFLTGVKGHFVGTLENVQITCEPDGYWYLGGTSGQDQLGGSAVALKFPNIRQVAVDGKAFSWKNGDQPVRLIKDGDGIVGLTDVGGRFGAEGNGVGLHLNPDGYWYLQGTSPYPQLKATAAVFAYPKGRD